MKKVITMLVIFVSVMANAQTYTNEYPKELTRLAEKWLKRANGATVLQKRHLHQQSTWWSSIFSTRGIRSSGRLYSNGCRILTC